MLWDRSNVLVLITVCLGVFIDVFASTIILPFLPQLIETYSGSQSEVGIIVSMYPIGNILGSLVFGSLQASSKRMLMIFGLLFLTVASLVMAFLQFLSILLLGRFLQGFASGAVWVVGVAMIGDWFPHEHIGKIMSLIFISMMLGNVAGPIVGGFLFEIYSGLPFLVVSGLCVLDFIFRLMVPERTTNIAENERCSVMSLFSQVLRNKMFLMVMTSTILCGVLAGAMDVILVLELQSTYGFTSGLSGPAFLVLLIPQIIASPIGGALYDRFGYRAVVFPGSCLMIIPIFTLMIPDLTLIQFLAIVGVLAFVSNIAFTPILPEVLKVVEQKQIIASYGIFNVCFGIGSLLGPIFASLMFEQFGLSWFALGLGLLQFINVPVSCLYKGSSKLSGENVKLDNDDDEVALTSV